MGEYINKETVKQKIQEMINSDFCKKSNDFRSDEFCKGVERGLYIAEEIINRCETDISKDKKENSAYWIEEYLGYGATRYRCSHCKAYIGESAWEYGSNDFCQNCGYAMK